MIYILGTGGNMPTKYRQTLSIFVNYMGKGILFDAGENTQRQMRLLNLSPTQIDYIFLTHIHGDHILGLPGILLSLSNQDYNRELTIFGPKGIKEVIEKIIDSFAININFPLKIKEIGETKIDFGPFYIESIYGIHQVPVLAYSFKEKDKIKINKEKLAKYNIRSNPKLAKLKEGKSVTINGITLDPKEFTYIQKGLKFTLITDTLFREQFIDFARDSDIIFHELAFLDKDKDKAIEHYHSTISDAFRIRDESNSKLLVFIHVSPRYQGSLFEIYQYLYNKKDWIIAEDLDYIEYKKGTIIYKRNDIVLYEYAIWRS